MVAVTNILRRSKVEARTGLSRSTIYAMVSRGKFPKPIKLTAYSVGWIESEVNEWVTARTRASRPVA